MTRNTFLKSWFVLSLMGCNQQSPSPNKSVFEQYVAVRAEVAALESTLTSQAWTDPSAAEATSESGNLLTQLQNAAEQMNPGFEFVVSDCSEYPCLFIGKTEASSPEPLWKTSVGQELRKDFTVFSWNAGECGDRNMFAVARYRPPTNLVSVDPALTIYSKRFAARLKPFQEKLCAAPAKKE
jgi:hypothetical protein